MKRTGFRYFIASIWIINIIFLFGSLYSILQNDKGELSYLNLGIIGVPFIFFIYLLRDITILKRPIFRKIIGIILILSSIFYIFVSDYLLILPTLITGVLVLKKCNT